MTAGLEALTEDRRKRIIHIETCGVTESRRTQSWDLRSFDAAGALLSLDFFHFDGTFSGAGMAAVEFIAITNDIVLIGSWRGSMRRDLWHIEAHAAETLIDQAAPADQKKSRFFGML